MSDFEWPEPVPLSGGGAEAAVRRAFARRDEATRRGVISTEWFTGTPMGLHPLSVCSADGPVGAGAVLGPYDRCPACGREVPLQTVDGFAPVSNCRSCTAPIVWASTADGKSMPVNAEVVAGGNVVLAVDGETITATVLDQDGLFGDGPRHVAHFVTCPDAGRWRR